MNFTISKSELSGSLQNLARVQNSKNAMQILDNFAFNIKENRLYAYASDGEARGTAIIPIVQSDGNFQFAINAKLLLERISSLPEQPLTFTLNEEAHTLTIKHNGGAHTIAWTSPEGFPEAHPVQEDGVQITLSSDHLLAGIDSTIFAVSTEEFRPQFQGINIDVFHDKIVFVATNSRMLSRTIIAQNTGEEFAHLLLPHKAASVLKAILSKTNGEVKLNFDASRAVFTISPTGEAAINYIIETRLLEGKFPSYNSVFPSELPYTINVGKTAITSALRNVSLSAETVQNTVKITIDNNTMKLETQNNELNQSSLEELSCVYSDEQIETAFNSFNLIAAVSAVYSDDIVLAISDMARAAVLRPAEPADNIDQSVLIMQIQL